MESQSRHEALQDVPTLNGERVFYVKETCAHNENHIPKANIIYRIRLYGNAMAYEFVSAECLPYLNVKNLRFDTDYSQRANTLEIALIVKSRYNIMFDHFMVFDYNTNKAIFEMKKYELESNELIPAKYYVSFYNENEYYNADDH